MNSNVTKNKKRDVHTELIRVVACISIIALHTWKNSGIDEVSVSLKGVIRNFEHFGVPCFFMIMGFYLFRGNKPYSRRVKDTLLRVVLPFIIAYIWYEIFSDWIMGERTFIDCLLSNHIGLISIFGDIISGSIECNSSFWYVYEYIKNIAFAPLIGLMCRPDEVGKKIRRGYEILCVISIALSNIVAFSGNLAGTERQIINLSPINVFVLYILIGYELNLFDKELLFRVKNNGIIFFIAYCVFNFIICFEEYIGIQLGSNDKAFFSENSIFQIASSVSIFIFLRTINISEGVVSNGIVFIGKTTYYVYLIHWTFTKLLASYNYLSLLDVMPGLIKYLGAVIIIFICSFIVALVIKGIEEAIVFCVIRKI